MSKQNISLLALSVIATAAVFDHRFVQNGATAAAAGRAGGVAKFDAAIGQTFSYDVIGTAVVVSGGAFAVGDALEVGAAGAAVVKAAGVAVARALEPSTGAGQFVEVLLIAN